MLLINNENKKSAKAEFLDKLISSLEEERFNESFKELKEKTYGISIYNNAFNENNPLGFIERDLASGKIQSFEDFCNSFKELSDLISESEVKKLCIKLFGNDDIFEKIDFFKNEYEHNSFLRERKILDSLLFNFGLTGDGPRRVIFSNLNLDTSDPDAQKAEHYFRKLIKESDYPYYCNLKNDLKKFFFTHPQNSTKLEFRFLKSEKNCKRSL